MNSSCDQVLDALSRWKGAIRLCGVELYEGVLKDEEAFVHFCSVPAM